MKYLNESESRLGFNQRLIDHVSKPERLVNEKVGFFPIIEANLEDYISSKHNTKKTLIKNQVKAVDVVYNDVMTTFMGECTGINATNLDDKNQRNTVLKKCTRHSKDLSTIAMNSSVPYHGISPEDTIFITATNGEDGEVNINVVTMHIKKYAIRIAENTYSTVLDHAIRHIEETLYGDMDVIGTWIGKLNRKIKSIKVDSSAKRMGYMELVADLEKKRKNAEVNCLHIHMNEGKLHHKVMKAIEEGFKCSSILQRRTGWELNTFIDIYNGFGGTKMKSIKRTTAAYRAQNKKTSIIQTLNERKQMLLHLPYEKYEDGTLKFLKEAIKDKKVITIRQTIYRVSKDSELCKLLIQAAEAGKDVYCMIELKAKLDEKNNLKIIDKMIDAGVRVVFGHVNLKTHAKMCIVTREKKKNQIDIYSNISTGNFNEKTAKVYEDVSLFSKDGKGITIGAEAIKVFNCISGQLPLPKTSGQLISSPNSMVDSIVREIKRCHGEGGHIFMKCNGLNDKRIAQALFEAANSGTKVDLVVRGLNIVSKTTKLLTSDAARGNITVSSVVGKVLEHSRIYKFSSIAGVTRTFIGSADMMTRNLDDRVEVLAEIKTPMTQYRIDKIIEGVLRDTKNTFLLGEDNKYFQAKTIGASFEDYDPNDCHAAFMHMYRKGNIFSTELDIFAKVKNTPHLITVNEESEDNEDVEQQEEQQTS